jgi:hypothetical protein
VEFLVSPVESHAFGSVNIRNAIKSVAKSVIGMYAIRNVQKDSNVSTNALGYAESPALKNAEFAIKMKSKKYYLETKTNQTQDLFNYKIAVTS